MEQNILLHVHFSFEYKNLFQRYASLPFFTFRIGPFGNLYKLEQFYFVKYYFFLFLRVRARPQHLLLHILFLISILLINSRYPTFYFNYSSRNFSCHMKHNIPCSTTMYYSARMMKPSSNILKIYYIYIYIYIYEN